MLVKIAALLAEKDTHTELKVELWIKHMGPVWKTSLAQMRAALVKWQAAMEKSGLAPNGTGEMDRFIYQILAVRCEGALAKSREGGE